MTSKTGYNHLQIGLHWLIALGIGANYIFSEGMEKALDASLEGTPAPDSLIPVFHVWIGVLVLALVLVRLVVRATNGAPSAVPGMQGRLAHWMHALLYLMMLAVPLGGAITWFLGADAFGEWHALGANVLIYLAGAHALVALFHQYVLKDKLLTRMIRAQ
ncbi:MAG: cytochrome b/b6 domain-containing protein [Paracoccaceae bacterium]